MTLRKAQTAPPYIPSQLGSGLTDWTTIAAGAVLFLLPVMIFTFLLRNHLLRGVTFGAVRKQRRLAMRRYARKLELLSMLVMIFGVIALCQPWNLFLHSYDATIILADLILFNIFSRISPPKTQRSAPLQRPSTN